MVFRRVYSMKVTQLVLDSFDRYPIQVLSGKSKRGLHELLKRIMDQVSKYNWLWDIIWNRLEHITENSSSSTWKTWKNHCRRYEYWGFKYEIFSYLLWRFIQVILRVPNVQWETVFNSKSPDYSNFITSIYGSPCPIS